MPGKKYALPLASPEFVCLQILGIRARASYTVGIRARASYTVGIRARASYTVSRHSIAELHHQAPSLFFPPDEHVLSIKWKQLTYLIMDGERMPYIMPANHDCLSWIPRTDIKMRRRVGKKKEAGDGSSLDL